MSSSIIGSQDLDRMHEPTVEHAPRLTWWAAAAAFLLPIAGIVIAIVLLARSEVGPGLAALLLSFLGMIAALAIGLS